VLGVTFKENCPDIRNSKVIDLIRELQSWGVRVVAADAWADAAEVQHEYGLDLQSADAVQGVDALVVAVGHHEYREMTPAQLRALCKGDKPVIADVKALYDRHQLTAAGFQVFRL
jgi:UDP-N-acetyl-D-galactosamine dehydrogenase